MGERKGLDARASGLMVILCIVWGLQQVILKLAAADIAPIMQIAIRCGLSALLVLPLLQLQPNTHLYSKAYLLPGIWLAFLFSAEFVFIAQALEFTSASHTVVLLYTAPIFVALGLHWKLPSERLSRLQWSGIMIAFAGIVMTFMGREKQLDQGLSQVLWGDFLALLAGLMWAMTTISLRLSKLNEAHPTQTLFYQLVGSFIFLFPLAFILGQAQIHWIYIAIGSLVFHTLIMSFMSLMLWFWLLRNYLASHLGVFSFLTPLFGMLFGILFLNETIELNFIVGTMLVMLGVAVVSMQDWIKRKLQHV
ncbi:DMT family transporter [Acinetobacter terrestris]|uniref:DMT family transporter n=1 Tax=Acinetobacter terrestris TaxID=2529843 RepID=A0AAW6UYV3_9GAMM|nr:DMT family transporter [Acinetobacter terrestris]MDK1684374.1 DMT family transporter [Acinetobacter terrestris]